MIQVFPLHIDSRTRTTKIMPSNDRLEEGPEHESAAVRTHHSSRIMVESRVIGLNKNVDRDGIAWGVLAGALR